jgi:hypothetical protein
LPTAGEIVAVGRGDERVVEERRRVRSERAKEGMVEGSGVGRSCKRGGMMSREVFMRGLNARGRG